MTILAWAAFCALLLYAFHGVYRYGVHVGCIERLTSSTPPEPGQTFMRVTCPKCKKPILQAENEQGAPVFLNEKPIRRWIEVNYAGPKPVVRSIDTYEQHVPTCEAQK